MKFRSTLQRSQRHPMGQSTVSAHILTLIPVLSVCMLLSGCQRPSPADVLLDKGQRNFLKGDWQSAREGFEEALTAYRTDRESLGEARALGNIATTYLMESDYTNALSYTETALNILGKLDKTSTSVLFSYGMAITNKGAMLLNLGGDMKNIERLLFEARQVQSDLWQRKKWLGPFSPIGGFSALHLTDLVHLNIGVLHRKQGDFNSGIAELLKVFKEGLVIQDRDMARTELVLTFIAAGKMDEARSFLEKPDRFGDTPDNQKIQRTGDPRFRLVQAITFMKFGLPQEAINTLNRVNNVPVSPELLAISHTLKGECLVKIGSRAQAVQEYSRARNLWEDVLRLVPTSMRNSFMEATVFGLRRIDLYNQALTFDK